MSGGRARQPACAALDTKSYPAGVKVTDAAVDMVNLKAARFHGDWNYTLVPDPPRRPKN